MSEPKVLAFAGSARQDSFNKQLVRIAAAGVESAGVACTLIDLRDYPLPIYDADLEAAEGLPESAVRLRALLASHQGLLIASPEYNSSISPLLKNAIDWATRSEDAQADLSGFQGRLAAVLAASPGALGGMRGLVVLRSLLSNIGCTVLADQVTIRQAGQAFEGGRLADDRNQKRVEGLGSTLGSWIRRLHAPA